MGERLAALGLSVPQPGGRGRSDDLGDRDGHFGGSAESATPRIPALGQVFGGAVVTATKGRPLKPRGDRSVNANRSEDRRPKLT